MILNNSPLANYHPHYTDDRFKHAQTIWGRKTEGIFYNYSDRLAEFDYDAYQEATEKANEKATPRSSLWVQEFLTAYHKRPVELLHILAGYNLSNGFPYQVFGYKFEE